MIKRLTFFKKAFWSNPLSKAAILTDAYYSFPGTLLLNAGFRLGIGLPLPPASHITFIMLLYVGGHFVTSFDMELLITE